ncbi:hypothetical protein LENED_011275 [Lentinula edodes]|uniref:Uncharacterized protein n=1 Tax=Lentinula edodes TaxID=5353 RepID=A0A1Q3EPL1_LENED|nr:hypothetical protein LENED_011275 [Lentinula edodes]
MASWRRLRRRLSAPTDVIPELSSFLLSFLPSTRWSSPFAGQKKNVPLQPAVFEVVFACSYFIQGQSGKSPFAKFNSPSPRYPTCIFASAISLEFWESSPLYVRRRSLVVFEVTPPSKKTLLQGSIRKPLRIYNLL